MKYYLLYNKSIHHMIGYCHLTDLDYDDEYMTINDILDARLEAAINDGYLQDSDYSCIATRKITKEEKTYCLSYK